MGNTSCRVCLEKGIDATANAWWHKAAQETNPPVIHPKVHSFKPESNTAFLARMRILQESLEKISTK